MANKPIGGTAYVFVGGKQNAIGGSVTYGGFSSERESKVGLDHGVDYVEKPVAPWVEIESKDKAGVDLVALANMTDTNVTVELANGKTVILSNAHQINSGEVDAAEGMGKFRFEGKKMEIVE